MPITRAYASAAQPGNAFLAGKNKIINGDFNINQRAFTSTTSNGYGFDRWLQVRTNGTVTYSTQSFTLGTAPVAGYESKNFARQVVSGHTGSASDYAVIVQRIESVRTLAGQTATLSFWAKADTANLKVAIMVRQSFGTGGSPSADNDTYAGQATLTTSWARYSVTLSVPSISGKTIGSNNDDGLHIFFFTSAGSTYNSLTGSLGSQNGTFDFWGVQLESGSVATPFQTATGTLAGELAACQRYYWRRSATGRTTIGAGVGESSTTAWIVFGFPTEMRAVPTTVEWSGLTVSDGVSYTESVTSINGATLSANKSYGRITFTTAGNIVQNRVAVGETASGGGHFALGAEL